MFSSKALDYLFCLFAVWTVLDCLFISPLMG